MRIPLPKMMRHWREREFERHLTPATVRTSLGAWAFLAKRPKLYHFAMSAALRAMKLFAFGRARLKSVPLAGGWTHHRDLPAPQGKTFQQQWRDGKGSP